MVKSKVYFVQDGISVLISIGFLILLILKVNKILNYLTKLLIILTGIPYHFAVKSCPTKDNIRIDIYIDFLLSVTNSMEFVSKISAENMEELLKATEAESVRSLVRTVRVDQALDLRGMNCDDMLATLNDKMNPYGITIEHVTIANVILPSDVTTRLQNTTTLESKQKLQNKLQQLSLLKLQGDQTRENTEQARRNEVSKTQELAKKSSQAILLEIEALKAKFDSQNDMIRVEKESKVSKMVAERSAALGVINRERETAVIDIKEAGKVEARKIEMEADKYVVKVQTETNLRVAENRAKMVRIRAEAEEYCAKRNVENKRAFCVKSSRLEIIRKMGENPNIVVCGEGSKDLVTLMFSSSKLSSELGIKLKSK